MSAVPTTDAPAPRLDRASLIRWIGGGALPAAILTAVVIAVWPASAAEKAHADGEQVGQAIGSLYYADSQEEVDAALADLDQAVADTREHAGDELADHVATQQDALDRAANGFVGSHTSEDAFEVDLYQAELNTAVDDLVDEANDFRAQGPEVHQSFWEGVGEGLPVE